MDKRAHRISVFLSSPGDLSAERAIVEDVTQQISRDIGSIDNFIVDLVRWETHSHSARGLYTQEVINTQIGDTYDIFLGMFGTRFGTPTKEFGSGTEEEFQRAFSRNKSCGLPEILFLFSAIAVPTDRIDASQLLLVQNFKKDLESKGVLYGHFESETSLRTKLYSDILHAIRRVLSARSDAGKEEVSAVQLVPIFDPLLEWHSMLHSDSEVNASVLMQFASTALGGMARDMDQLSKATSKLTTGLKRETITIAKQKTNNNLVGIASSIARAAEALAATTRQLFDIAPRLHKNLTDGLTFSLRSFEIFRSRDELSISAVDSVLSPLTLMANTLESLVVSLEEFVESLSDDILPNTSFSVERRKLRALTLDIIRIVKQGNKDLRLLKEVLVTDTIE